MAKVNITRNADESEADFRRRYHREWERQDRESKGIAPKVKPHGPCSVDGCERDAEVKGMCGNHYRAFRAKVRAEVGSPPAKKRGHPLYMIWFERKNRGSLCDEWANDFWKFVEMVGAQPSPTHLLRRFTTKRPYMAGNWEWLDALKREPDEPKEMFNSRKWASRKARFPDFEVGRHLMRVYGISADDYKAMLEEQDGVCATCGSVETAKRTNGTLKALAVDHCHTTGRVRGLLCWACNSILGRVKDDPVLLRAMASYLERPQALGLPPRPG